VAADKAGAAGYEDAGGGPLPRYRCIIRRPVFSPLAKARMSPTQVEKKPPRKAHASIKGGDVERRLKVRPIVPDVHSQRRPTIVQMVWKRGRQQGGPLIRFDQVLQRMLRRSDAVEPCHQSADTVVCVRIKRLGDIQVSPPQNPHKGNRRQSALGHRRHRFGNDGDDPPRHRRRGAVGKAAAPHQDPPAEDPIGYLWIVQGMRRRQVLRPLFGATQDMQQYVPQGPRQGRHRQVHCGPIR